MEYKINEPYPSIKVVSKNIEYAKILLHSYAGKVSEDTAIHMYIYQSFILDSETAKILKEIAIVEMHHLELLAKTINLLGLNPEFGVIENNYVIPWNASNVIYAYDITDILKINISSEEQAINNYLYSISVINDPHVKKLLERIIKDELLHIQIFNNLLQEKNS